MTISEHIASVVLNWCLEGESPELEQVIFSVISVRKVRKGAVLPFTSYCSAHYGQMQRWRIYSCLTMLSLLHRDGPYSNVY